MHREWANLAMNGDHARSLDDPDATCECDAGRFSNHLCAMDRFSTTHKDLIKSDLTAVNSSLADRALCECPVCDKEVIDVVSLKSYLSKSTENFLMRHVHQHGTLDLFLMFKDRDSLGARPL